MKKTVKVFSVIAVIAVLFTACAENFTFPERPLAEGSIIIPVENIVGIPTGSRPGLEIVLSGTVMPENATNKRIVWSITGNGAGATLERNRLFTSGEGNVTVTATIKNGSGENIDYTQDFNILISTKMIAVSSITGIPETLSVGEYELRGRVIPSNALNKTILYSVKDAGTTGASIYGDVLTIESPGTVIITATVADGRLSGNYTQDFAIVIPYISVTDITGIPDVISPGNHTLNGIVVPSEASNTTITCSVIDAGTTGAEIDGNILNTTATGTVTVRAAIANGVSYGEDFTKDFTITISFIAVTDITGIPLTIMVGEHELIGVVTPSGAANTIVWNVENAGTTGATINGNTLNTTATGTITIKATIAGGLLNGNYTQDFTITITERKVVYAAGNYVVSGRSRACYWKDGVFYDLHPAGATESYTTGIVVVNGTSYIAGYVFNSDFTNFAGYWEDGEFVSIFGGYGQNVETFSIAVDGTTVYFTGWGGSYLHIFSSEFFSNLQFYNAEHSGNLNEDSVNRLAINNGNLYIPFQTFWDDNDVTKYNNYIWNGLIGSNNTQLINMGASSDTDIMVHDIIFMNNTMYLAGSANNKPFYWATGNSNYTSLDTNNGKVSSIVVQDGSPLFYGEASGTPCYWNASGTKTNLTSSYKTSVVACSGSDVFISYSGSEGTGYRGIGGAFTRLYGANGTTNVQVTGLAVQ